MLFIHYGEHTGIQNDYFTNESHEFYYGKLVASFHITLERRDIFSRCQHSWTIVLLATSLTTQSPAVNLGIFYCHQVYKNDWWTSSHLTMKERDLLHLFGKTL